MIADFNAINIDKLDDLNKRYFYNVVFSNLSPLNKYMYDIQLSTYYQGLDNTYYTPYSELIDRYAELNKTALNKLQPLIEGIDSRLKVTGYLPKNAPDPNMEMGIDGGRKKSRSRSSKRSKSKRAKSKRAKSKRAKSKKRH